MSRLTPEEREVLEALVNAHNLFVKLPVQHPEHHREWMLSMNQLQRLVLSRPTARAEGLVWNTGENDAPTE